MELMKIIRYYSLTFTNHSVIGLLIPVDNIELENWLKLISVDHILNYTVVFWKNLSHEPLQRVYVNDFK